MRTLLLDRDGVINVDSPRYIRSADDWQPVPGSLAAIARAQHAGWRIIVVSNQSGIGRGLYDIAALNGIHRRLTDELALLGAHVDAFFFCPHTPDDGCECRKPQAGLLRTIQRRLALDWNKTLLVGDKLSDAEAARSAGVRAVLVQSGLERPDASAAAALGVTTIYADLDAVVDDLLSMPT